ncbi:MAG: hypothetical protein ACE5R6_08195 [Candidatus Heimdallarchaeota archaeon]
MALEVSAVDKILTGSTIDIRVTLNLEKPVEMRWGGISLILERPCDRNFPVVTSELFCEGYFEVGLFVRSRSITVNPRVLPSIPNRGITYKVRSDVSFQEPGSDTIIDLLDEKSIDIWKRPSKIPHTHPINISLKGLNIQTEKDVYTPGEQCKIDLVADNEIATLQVKLIHEANVICKCPSFANICTHIHESPSKTLASVELESVHTESIELKVPETAEESHSFTWQPSDQIGWYHSVEDSSKYYLEIEGRNVFNEVISVTIPIQVLRPSVEEWEEPLLIQPEQEIGASLFFAKKPNNLLNITGHEIEGNRLILHVRNVTNRILEGVTFKVAGLVEELFERFPQIIGIAKWAQNEEKFLTYNKYAKEIKEYQITIEDNEGSHVTHKYSLRT